MQSIFNYKDGSVALESLFFPSSSSVLFNSGQKILKSRQKGKPVRDRAHMKAITCKSL